MFKQYKVYVNFLEKADHVESIHATYDLAMEHANKVKNSENFTKEVNNVFITKEGFDEGTGKMLLEEDIYCYRNKTGDTCMICGKPIEEGRLRQNENEEIVCEDCFNKSLTHNLQ